MRVRLAPATRFPRPPWWAACIVVVWGALIFVSSAAFAGDGSAGPMCHLKRLTGMPCPTCGSSRGMRAIADGEPALAWSLNPVFFTVVALGAALVLFRLATAKKLAVRFTPVERRMAWIVAALVFLGGWAYVIWRQS